jgi:inorganic pyrophosphatase
VRNRVSSQALKLPTTVKGFITVVIETPRGATPKLAFDPTAQVFGYVRPLPVGMMYPYDWGFIPSTVGEDGDPLDGLVIHQASSAPGVVIKCNLLGALRVKQKDEGGEVLRNDRYVLCPHREDAPDEPVAADHVPDDLRREIEQFFLSSVVGTGKTIKFKGWQNAAEARRAIKKGMNAFSAHR